MCVRTQLAPNWQTLQVGETSRISRGSPERVLNNDRSCPMVRRSVSCRGTLEGEHSDLVVERDLERPPATHRSGDHRAAAIVVLHALGRAAADPDRVADPQGLAAGGELGT